MGTVALRVADAAKTFHRDGASRAAFTNIDLEVREGEILALLGPSGCGKSTLLRAIAGIEPVSRGTITLHTDPVARGRTGIVFQDPLLLPWLTISENVALGLGYAANRRVGATETVEAILRDFGIDDLADAYPASLSGGQAQRVSLARTIVTHPRVLLLDEPFAALDPRTRAHLRDWVVDVVRRRHLTAVIVTHDIEEALVVGDRIALMSCQPGTITRIWSRGEGNATEVLAAYQSELPAPTWVI
ncbi:MAG: ABC transporter ATP-binding protein [Chloroflexota bacterium]|nr:MAG: ABC transporter ATP-binding protein [Chloroflexota bacterium]